MYNIALLHQQLFRFGAYCFDDGFSEEILFVKAFYTGIEIDRGYNKNEASAKQALKDPRYFLTRQARHIAKLRGLLTLVAPRELCSGRKAVACAYSFCQRRLWTQQHGRSRLNLKS